MGVVTWGGWLAPLQVQRYLIIRKLCKACHGEAWKVRVREKRMIIIINGFHCQQTLHASNHQNKHWGPEHHHDPGTLRIFARKISFSSFKTSTNIHFHPCYCYFTPPCCKHQIRCTPASCSTAPVTSGLSVQELQNQTCAPTPQFHACACVYAGDTGENSHFGVTQGTTVKIS